MSLSRSSPPSLHHRLVCFPPSRFFVRLARGVREAERWGGNKGCREACWWGRWGEAVTAWPQRDSAAVGTSVGLVPSSLWLHWSDKSQHQMQQPQIGGGHNFSRPDLGSLTGGSTDRGREGKQQVGRGNLSHCDLNERDDRLWENRPDSHVTEHRAKQVCFWWFGLVLKLTARLGQNVKMSSSHAFFTSPKPDLFHRAAGTG